jgi:hypothetical protein
MIKVHGIRVPDAIKIFPEPIQNFIINSLIIFYSVIIELISGFEFQFNISFKEINEQK